MKFIYNSALTHLLFVETISFFKNILSSFFLFFSGGWEGGILGNCIKWSTQICNFKLYVEMFLLVVVFASIMSKEKKD